MYEGEDRGKWMSEEHLGAEAKGGAVWGCWLGGSAQVPEVFNTH